MAPKNKNLSLDLIPSPFFFYTCHLFIDVTLFIFQHALTLFQVLETMFRSAGDHDTV